MKVKQQESLNTNISVFTVPRYDDSIVHSARVVDWINQVFKSQLTIEVVGNPKLHHSFQVVSGIREKQKSCDIILCGSTKKPPHLPNGPSRGKSLLEFVVDPFLEYTKAEVVKLAYSLNLKKLVLLSHTCTESKTVRCTHCWQCKEREWAFSVNNYIDLGTM